MARAREPIRARIERSISLADGCWIWNGSYTRDGYGVLTVGRQQVRAHRASYSEFKGDIPPQMVVCHRCDNPKCVNPDHLFLGTHRDNTQDMIAKGRRPALSGADHPNIKVLPDQRQQIADMRKAGSTLKEIAAKFGISFQRASAIAIEETRRGTAQ